MTPKDWLDYITASSARRLPIIRQAEAAECGLASLTMLAVYYGYKTDLAQLRRQFPISMKGATLSAIMKIAAQLGLATRALRCEPKHLGEIRLPCIMHIDMDHFVVLKSVLRNGDLLIHDPALGSRRIPAAEVGRHMSGIVLEVYPTPNFQPKQEAVRLNLFDFWGRIEGLRAILLQTLALSVLLQLTVIVGPFFMQLAVDHVTSKVDIGFLGVLALGFAMLVLISTATSSLRSLFLIHLSSQLQFQTVLSLFHHLVRLPLRYFEQRSVGHILSCFQSTQPLRDLLSKGLVSAIVDGVMAVFTLVAIFFYSVELSLICLGAVLLYALVRIATKEMARHRTVDSILAGAMEQTHFVETLRSVQCIKLQGLEPERESQWLQRFAELINKKNSVERVTVIYGMAESLLFGLQDILLIYVGIQLVISSHMTTGMLFAFFAYKLQFQTRTIALVEQFIAWALMSVHIQRLADIALEPIEAGLETGTHEGPPIAGAVEATNLSFRYSEFDAMLLQGLDLSVKPGEFVAIIGSSGAGKSSLFKILLGLLPPTDGAVTIDGKPITQIGVRNFRSQISTVMQEDKLLAGSILDNVTIGAAGVDYERLQQITKLCCIADDIERMPMGYHTLVGDLGSSLSGGQRQRILLARALYREPKILFLDESTAHLDPKTERDIVGTICNLPMTRIVIAHSPALMVAADRVVALHGGKLVDVSRDGLELMRSDKSRLEALFLSPSQGDNAEVQ